MKIKIYGLSFCILHPFRVMSQRVQYTHVKNLWTQWRKALEFLVVFYAVFELLLGLFEIQTKVLNKSRVNITIH